MRTTITRLGRNLIPFQGVAGLLLLAAGVHLVAGPGVALIVVGVVLLVAGAVS